MNILYVDLTSMNISEAVSLYEQLSYKLDGDLIMLPMNTRLLYDCMPEGIQLTRGAFLAKIKQQRGGQCIRCGYSKCLKALEFHHLDPSQKDFTISNDHFKLQEAVEESKKCILLCSNCHKELHDNMWTIDELNLEEKEEVKPDGIN